MSEPPHIGREPPAFGRRGFLLAAAALAVGAPEAAAQPARDWAVPATRRAGGAGPRALRDLARRVRGPVLRHDRGVYNLRYAGVRPDAVVHPLDGHDVQAVLRWADRHDVRVAARSGGHSYAGYSTTKLIWFVPKPSTAKPVMVFVPTACTISTKMVAVAVRTVSPAR